MTCQCDMHGRGYTMCHCRLCCQTFASVSGYGRHIVNMKHVEPSERGMHTDSRGVWRLRRKNLPVPAN